MKGVIAVASSNQRWQPQVVDDLPFSSLTVLVLQLYVKKSTRLAELWMVLINRPILMCALVSDPQERLGS